MPSRPFKPYMGKNTFGVLKESKEAGEYILKKKAITTFCSPNVCTPSRTVVTQSNRLLLKKANAIYFGVCQDPYNTANLNINLVTVLDLSGVPVIQQNDPYAVPAQLDVTSIPYLDYIIDPCGNLFGNTICGTNNYQNYLKFNINSNSITSDFYNKVVRTENYKNSIQDALKGPTSSSLISLDNQPWYNGNGTWYNLTTGPDNPCYDITSFENKLYLGGSFLYSGGISSYRIAVYDLTTNTSSPLGTGLDNPDPIAFVTTCFSIAISPDGTNIYAGGDFTQADGMSANYIAVWNTITNSWSPLGSGLNNVCRSIAISPDGTNVYAGGDFTQAGDFIQEGCNKIAVWNTITNTWSPLGSGLNATCRKIAISPDGTKLYAGGQFTQAGCNYIAVYDLITNTWSPLGSGLNATCWDIAISPDGTNVYVCGSFTLAGGISANRIAVWNTITNTWSPFGSGLNSTCFSLSLLNSHIYVTGNFLFAGGISAKRIAVYDLNTNTWSQIGSPYSYGINTYRAIHATSYGLFHSVTSIGSNTYFDVYK